MIEAMPRPPRSRNNLDSLSQTAARQPFTPSRRTPLSMIEHPVHAKRFRFQHGVTGQVGEPV
jgi:hypothetical protein